MKHLLFLPISLLSVVAFADPGDTTIVQTFTFEEQFNPNQAYNSPGRRWFQFPDDETTYQKILIYYTLKCFDQGTTAGGLGFACGEWDYLTYNYLYEHTGLMDSTAATHPLYRLNNQNFTTANYTNTPVVNQRMIMQSNTIAEPIGPETTFGESADWLGNPTDGFALSGPSFRTQFIITAEELLATGASAGPLHKLGFFVDNGSGTMAFLEVKMRHIDQSSLNGFINQSLTTVYSRHTDLTENQWNELTLNSPFEWNGTSHLLVELNFSNPAEGPDVMLSGSESPDNPAIASFGGDRYILFDGGDEVVVPPAAFADLTDEITVSFWLYGTPEFQPENGTTFEGVNAANQRVINSHTPWGNGRVYWDAGQENGYDRIDKQAAITEYSGKWNHWTFTKNATTGVMDIYLNGTLWHTGNNRYRTMEDIVRFSIGSATGWSNHYRGAIDEFAVFKKALPQATIAQWLSKDIDATHPDFGDLLFYYNFNEPDGSSVIDHSGNGHHGIALGNPSRKLHKGSDLFRNVASVEHSISGIGIRPNVRFMTGDYVFAIADEVVTIDEPVAPVSLAQYAVDGNFAVIQNVQYVWVEEQELLFDLGGTSSVIGTVVLEETVTNGTLSYFNPPFQVINRWEIGRFITPYGIGLSLGPDGWTWIYDVTDWAPMLKGMVELEAGNWQELLDMKFVFIEGTPPRDVKRIEKVWNGDFQLSTWDNNIQPKTLTKQPGEETVKLAATTSGHWFGQGNNCAEFCYNIHKLNVNGQQQWNWQIIEECADNPLFPQGGTWIYDRAGWCPGAPVTQRDFELTPHVQNNQVTVEYDITPDPYGNYVFETHAFWYGSPNHQFDVEIDRVMSPSLWKIRSRDNPICDQPVVRIRNKGAQPLTSCTFTYGMNGQNETFQWTGNLGFMQSVDVTLSYSNPAFYIGSTTETLLFEVTVSNPNGNEDQNPSNNYATSAFKRPPNYQYPNLDDNRIIVQLNTNLAPWESSVKLYNQDGAIVWQRNYTQANTLHRDTIAINPGCYLLHITDSDDDGLSFFANNDGGGSVSLRRVSGVLKQFGANFGKEIKHYFHWNTNLINVQETQPITREVSVFPNPSGGVFHLDCGDHRGTVLVETFDIQGRKVSSTRQEVQFSGHLLNVDLSSEPAGLYVIRLRIGEDVVSKRVSKL